MIFGMALPGIDSSHGHPPEGAGNDDYFVVEKTQHHVHGDFPPLMDADQYFPLTSEDLETEELRKQHIARAIEGNAASQKWLTQYDSSFARLPEALRGEENAMREITDGFARMGDYSAAEAWHRVLGEGEGTWGIHQESIDFDRVARLSAAIHRAIEPS